MPWRKPNRFISTLLGTALGFVITAAWLSMLHNGELTSSQERIVTACLLGATFCIGFARMEYLNRKTKHDLIGEANATRLSVITAAIETQRAMDAMPENVVRKINGGLERAADSVVTRKLDESPFPTTREELEKFVREVRSADSGECIHVAEKAAELAIAKYRAGGVS